MSAFIVDKAHIDALIAVALHGPTDGESRWEGGPRWAAFDPRETDWQGQEWRQAAEFGTGNPSVKAMSPDNLGEMLTLECVRSVSYRYPDVDSLPGPCEQYWEQYFEHQRPSHRLTIVQALKAIDCYEYQSCEHTEWIDSEAKRFCDGLRGSLIGVMPGYSSVPWGVEA